MTLRLDEWQSCLYLCGTAWDKAAIEEYIADDLYIRQVQEPVAVVLSTWRDCVTTPGHDGAP